MAKIVTIGEIMLRLSTPGNSRFVQSDSFDVNYGGGEANVAVSLQNFGNEAFFVSKIPAHGPSMQILRLRCPTMPIPEKLRSETFVRFTSSDSSTMMQGR